MQELFPSIYRPANLQAIRIPWLGSKIKIAPALMDEMLKVKPNAKYFYDICGGGGAMSFTALQYGFEIFYNEYQKSMANFVEFVMERIRTGKRSQFGIFPEEYYEFVSREQFFEEIKKDTPFSQFCRIVYSFGNNQKDYLYGKPIERQKYLTHQFIVFQDKEALKEFNETFEVNFTLPTAKTWNERRLQYKSEWNAHLKADTLFQEMLASGHIKNIPELTTKAKKEWIAKHGLNGIKNLERIQNLESIKKLECIENLPRLESIILLNKQQHLLNINSISSPANLSFGSFSISSLDYKDVKITTPIEESIIYIDPPYRQTQGYKESLDHNELDQWFKNNPYTCFMSEYNAPFEAILEIPKMKILNNKGIDKREYAIEKLFWNGK